MPDFDIDFCMNRRDEVIEYVTDKYGKDNVGQIATFHQLKARRGVRDIARAMAHAVRRGRQASPSSCPSRSRARRPPIAEAIEQEPRLKALYDENPTYRDAARSSRRGSRG